MESAEVNETEPDSEVMMKQMLLDQSQQSHQVIMFQNEDTTTSIATKDYFVNQDDDD